MNALKKSWVKIIVVIVKGRGFFNKKKRPSPTYVYYYQCSACNIELNTDRKEEVCPHCKKPMEDVGLTIGEPIPRTFLQKLAYKLGDYLQ